MWLIVAITFSEWLRHKQRVELSTPPVAGARFLSYVLVCLAVLFYTVFSMHYHLPFASISAGQVVSVSKASDIFSSEQMKYTETLIGERQEPINYIFLAEDDTRLVNALQQAGWTLTDKADIASFVKAVKAWVTKTPHLTAPVSPSFWNAKIQDMSFRRVPEPNRLVHEHRLRIWRTGFSLKDGLAVYIGMVNGTDGLKLGILPRLASDLDTQRDLLLQELARTGMIENLLKRQLVNPQIGKNFVGDQFFTDGKVHIITLKNR